MGRNSPGEVEHEGSLRTTSGLGHPAKMTPGVGKGNSACAAGLMAGAVFYLY